MEGKSLKSVIIGALILGLVLEAIQVEAKSCCPSTTARNIYNTCRFGGASRQACAKLSGCKIVDGKCKPPYDKLTLFPHSDESDVSDFCKLGCMHSVCEKINTAFSNEEANDAVERCNDACLSFCTNDVDAATVVA
ncbi:leaf-specific thionin DB4-like [Phragmites australis]|uniref:leaf-specific thionin DB4-like n=1 Tax=Phragmites australis TaxID=29695 RepID=UPI002D79ACDB|nr:leaf-specific thionin DB4-like [Phragmites australis]